MKTRFFALGILVCCLIFSNFLFCGFAVVDETKVEMHFSYGLKTYVWNDDFWPKTDNFVFQEKMQKNGRQKSHLKRAELIENIMKLGFSIEDAFDYTFFGFKDLLKKMCDEINTPMKNAEVKFFPDRQPMFVFSNEQTGFEVETQKLLQSALKELKKSPRVKVEIKPKVITPQTTRKELEQKSVLRSRFSTNFASSSENRKQNIKTALKNFNGLLIYPEKTYSFNAITGRRTEAKGYKEANIILNNEYVEAFGGGVCQVSTTIFNALLLADVHIKESHSHSLQSSYIENGFDAMVNFGSSDLKWVNKSSDILYRKTYTTESEVVVEIYGPKNKFDIERSFEIQKELTFDDLVVEDPNLEQGTSFYKIFPKKGCSSKSFLKYYKNGKLLKTNMIRKQTYKAVQGVKIVGTKLPQNFEPENYVEWNTL